MKTRRQNASSRGYVVSSISMKAARQKSSRRRTGHTLALACELSEAGNRKRAPFVTRCVNASRKYVRHGAGFALDSQRRIRTFARARMESRERKNRASERASESVVSIQYNRPAAILKSAAMQIWWYHSLDAPTPSLAFYLALALFSVLPLRPFLSRLRDIDPCKLHATSGSWWHYVAPEWW